MTIQELIAALKALPRLRCELHTGSSGSGGMPGVFVDGGAIGGPGVVGRVDIVNRIDPPTTQHLMDYISVADLDALITRAEGNPDA